MSIIRNRELSQFGSVIFVDNVTGNVGISTTATPYIGIGTTNPTVKFEVVGDTNISGDLTVSNGSINATSYNINGNPLVDATILQWNYSTNLSDIYKLSGNVGIGTSVIPEKLTVRGNVSAGQFISTVSTGTPPLEVSSLTLVTHLNADYLRGKTPPTGSIVGDTDSQILTNKTLTLPTFGSSGVRFSGSTSGISTVRAAATASGIVVIPSVTGIQTFVTTGTVGLVTSGMIADLSIENVDVAAGAGISYSKLNLTNSVVNADIASGAAIAISKLAAFTISGVSLGNALNSLTAGSYINYNSGSTYNGSSAITVSAAGTSINTASTLVARDGSGDFTAGTITGSAFNATTTDAFRISGTTVINSSRNLINVVNANFSGIITATDFNSTSDINLKENIHTVENSLETISSLRGVSFDWKESGKKSYGVIAQELQEVLPELVGSGEIKSVNYNGLIGVLIEAVKELSAEIEELKKKTI
jgi:hypothetical protein